MYLCRGLNASIDNASIRIRPANNNGLHVHFLADWRLLTIRIIRLFFYTDCEPFDHYRRAPYSKDVTQLGNAFSEE